MAKKRTTIYLDEQTADELDLILQCSRSEFFQKLADDYLNSKTDIQKLEEERKVYEDKILAIDYKIEELKRIEEKNTKDKDMLKDAYDTLDKLAKNNGVIFNFNLKHISKSRRIRKAKLEEYCKSKNYVIQ